MRVIRKFRGNALVSDRLTQHRAMFIIEALLSRLGAKAVSIPMDRCVEGTLEVTEDHGRGVIKLRFVPQRVVADRRIERPRRA